MGRRFSAGPSEKAGCIVGVWPVAHPGAICWLARIALQLHEINAGSFEPFSPTPTVG